MRHMQKFMGLAALAGMVLQPFTAGAAVKNLTGAGATFPYPIYSKWFDEFNKNTGVQINYQSIGSGGGIRQITSRTVDFGATDGPMTDKAIFAADGKILHIPTVLGAVVPIYNVKGVEGLKISGPVLADIYLGKITKWNDAAIASLNAGIALPDAPIVVVRRSDGSGTTYCFVDYLAKVSPEWKKKVGVNTSVNWPVGLGGKGNEGVTGTVKQTPNSIGYVELIYAKQNNLDFMAVQNKAGKFVTASIEGVTAAAASASMPADFRVSITDAPGADAYPISTFTWLLVYEKTGGERAEVIKNFLNWMLEEGQPMASALGYAPLPASVNDMVKKTVATIK